jgi:hypothetical protein
MVVMEASKFSLLPNESCILILIVQPTVFDKNSKREPKLAHNESVHLTKIIMEKDSGTRLIFPCDRDNDRNRSGCGAIWFSLKELLHAQVFWKREI